MTKAWETLTDSGIQETAYPDNPRLDVRNMFAFEPSRILDVGCGLGAVSGSIKHSLPHVFAWGCELNPVTATMAESRLDKVTRLSVDEWAIEELELLKTIDTVLLLDVLEHMYNPWATLKVLSAHLPAHAQLIVSLPNVANIHVMHEMARGFWHYKPAGVLDVTHIRFFTLYEMRKMFLETGFKIQLQHYPYFQRDVSQNKNFPMWFKSDSIQVLIRDQEHWNTINADQIYFRLIPCPNEMLNEFELSLRVDAHPPTAS